MDATEVSLVTDGSIADAIEEVVDVKLELPRELEDSSEPETVDMISEPDITDTDITDTDSAPGDIDDADATQISDAVQDSASPLSDADVDEGPDSEVAQDVIDPPEEDAPPPTFVCSDTEQLELYTSRIEPLVSGNAISSCNQCHLSGIDLSIYVQGSPCETMSCMVAQGFVDLAHPKESPVLAQILQAEPQSALITSEVIDEEYEGFLEWIQFSAACHELVCDEAEDACGSGPGETANVPEGVLTPLGSCDETSLLELFDDRVYDWKGRCHGCHDDCENEKWDAPCWLVDPGGDASPEALKEASSQSMYNLIGIGAFDPYDPPASLALLKPMALNMGGIEHGGGDKFYDFADAAYQDFMVFALQYGSCYQGVEPWWPTVTIVQPASKAKFYQGEALPVLQGTATDPQDGPITDDTSYLWTRFEEEGEDQVLATGPGPHEIDLPLGKHILTLTATDSDGNASSRSIKVWMKTSP